MKKRFCMILALVFLFQVSVFAGVTLRYYNKDSQSYTFDVKIAGSSKEVTFDGSRTSSVTIQGGSDEAEILTEQGWVEVEDGDNVEIKDGKITVN